jgi:hypothetical protein
VVLGERRRQQQERGQAGRELVSASHTFDVLCVRFTA